MSTFGFALEFVNTNNNGANYVSDPLAADIVVYGYQASGTVSNIIQPSSPVYVEGAMTGWFVNSAPTFTPPNGTGGGVLSPNPAWSGPGKIVNANTGLIAGGMGTPINGLLFNRFFNLVIPGHASFDCCMSGLEEIIPKGSYLIIHIEHNSVVYSNGNYGPAPNPCDIQLTGTIFHR